MHSDLIFFLKISFCSSFFTIRNIISLPLLVKSSFLTNDVRERGSRDESAKNVKAEGLESYQFNFTVILYRKPLYIWSRFFLRAQSSA